MATDKNLLIGKSEAELCPCWNGVLVHRQILEPLTRLREASRDAGFELQVASGFRSFERQQAIWARKLSGERPLFGLRGELIDPSCACEDEVLASLLRWSALPGASRHHWGTDLDVYDAGAVAADYVLQLSPEEYLPGGPFAEFAVWLRQTLASDSTGFGFFQPYAEDIGGVAPEPWHISYRPLAEQFERDFDRCLFDELLEQAEWPFQALIRQQAASIYARYVQRLSL